MRKILPLALFMMVLMVASTWCIGWFLQARHVRAQVALAMASVDPSLGAITAKSIATSGFPAKMIVTITDPTFTFNMKTSLARLHKRTMAVAGSSAAVLTTPEYPEATLSHTLSGTVTLTLNALSDSLSMRYAGTDTTRLMQPASTTSMHTEYNGDTVCNMRMDRKLTNLITQMWNLQKFFSVEGMVLHLRQVTCNFPGGMTTDADSHQILSSLAPSTISFTTQPTEARYNAGLTVSLNDYEVMPAGDAAMQQFGRVLTPLRETYSPFSMSLYGKQSIALDATIDAPQEMQNSKAQPFHLEIKKLSFSNAAGLTEGTMLFSAKPEGTVQKGELAVDFTSEFNPRQSEIARANIGQFVVQMKKEPKFLDAIGASTTEQIEAALFDALPNITQLGPITQKIRMGFAVDSTNRTGSVNIAELQLTTRDYGLLGNMDSNVAAGQVLPTVNASLTCRKCIAMVDVAVAYLMRVDNALATLAPENAGKVALDASQVEGIKNLLSVIGTPVAAAGDLLFVVKSNAGAIDINGKSMQELMQLVQQHMMAAPTAPVVAQ